MKTYQDLEALGEDEQRRMDFVQDVIRDHKGSKLYSDALTANEYYAGRNITINNVQKFIRDAFGRKIPDIWSPNHKIACNYYGQIVNYLVLYMLGNGVSFGKEDTRKRLGDGFDKAAKDVLTNALNNSVGYGFVNDGKVMPFDVKEFAALPDEETSAIRAGVRYWQLDNDKPLRVTLYEEDGYTDYIRQSGDEMTVLHEKRPYIQIVQTSEATGEQIVDGRNYPSFPIVPLYNVLNKTELEGNRGIIDALDLMMSQLVNNVDEGQVIYWLIKNAGGTDQVTANQIIQTLKTAGVAMVDTEEDITAHSPIVQFEASKEAIEQLRRQLYDNMGGLDIKSIAGGADTATQIRASYELLDTKAALLEFQLVEFIEGVLAVMGIDDKPTFARSPIVNQMEMVRTIVSAGADLPQEYKTRKILEILGDIDRVDEVLEQLTAEDANRFTNTVPEV